MRLCVVNVLRNILKNSAFILLMLLPAVATSANNNTVEKLLSIFQPGSYEKIVKGYKDRPFLMVFWSLDCPPCFRELGMLGELAAKYPDFNLVLVSTDSLADKNELLNVINNKGLSSADAWVFSEVNSSQLRYEVDRIWYGELPRSYFFDAQHQRQAVSGVLDQEVIENWRTLTKKTK